MVYLLQGDPLPYREHKFIKGIWGEYKQEQLKRGISLESQLDGKKPISGAVHVDYVFAFDVTLGRSTKITSNHMERPTLDDLIKYVNTLAKDRVYHPESVISFSAKKIYSHKPSTSFKVTPIEKGGKSEENQKGL